MAAQLPLRENPLMDVELTTEDLITKAIAANNCKEAYDEAYNMYEWGQEFFIRNVGSMRVQNERRAQHYQQRGWFFEMLVNDELAIRRFSGQQVNVYLHICENFHVLSFATQVVMEYHNSRPNRSYPRVPLCAKLLIMIAMNYLDTGSNFKQSMNLFQIPRISFLIRKGLEAICKLDNIQLPTTEAEWITSMLGFKQMHGLPNVALSVDVTPVKGMTKLPEYKCPQLQDYILKVITAVDSSGKYCAKGIFNGSLLEPELIQSWDFYHRLKATEVGIGLPGVNAEPIGDALPLLGYPTRVKWPADDDGFQPQIETTAAGILVDNRYSDVDCSLFITSRDAGRRMHIFNQRFTRTRFFHERLFGTFSQYNHLKQRPMQMDITPANHPIHMAITAALMISNVRVGLAENNEHACLR